MNCIRVNALQNETWEHKSLVVTEKKKGKELQGSNISPHDLAGFEVKELGHACITKNFYFQLLGNYTLSISNCRLFWFFYIHCFCYGPIRGAYIHSKNYVSRKAKMTYNLKRREYYLK